MKLLGRIVLRLLHHWNGPSLQDENDRLWRLVTFLREHPPGSPGTRAEVERRLREVLADALPAGVHGSVHLIEERGFVEASVFVKRERTES